MSDDPAETGVQSEPPPNRPNAGQDHTNDTQGMRRPIKRPSAVARKNMMLWLAGAGCGALALLSCLICGGVGVWWYTSHK